MQNHLAVSVRHHDLAICLKKRLDTVIVQQHLVLACCDGLEVLRNARIELRIDLLCRPIQQVKGFLRCPRRFHGELRLGVLQDRFGQPSRPHQAAIDSVSSRNPHSSLAWNRTLNPTERPFEPTPHAAGLDVEDESSGPPHCAVRQPDTARLYTAVRSLRQGNSRTARRNGLLAKSVGASVW